MTAVSNKITEKNSFLSLLALFSNLKLRRENFDVNKLNPELNC